MKDLLKYLPGLGSDKAWIKTTSSILYVMYLLLSLIAGPGFFLIVGGLILIGVSVKELIMSRKNKLSFKTPVMLLVVSLILLGSGSELTSRKSIAAKESEQIILLSEENENLKSENKQLTTENATLKENNEILALVNAELKEVNDEFIAKEKEIEEEEAKKQEEIRLADEAEKEKAEQEAKKQEEAKKVEQEKKEKEAQVAKSQQTAKSNNNSNQSVSKPASTNSAPAKQGVDNTAQILRTKSGKMYHKRKCGNGNFYATTLNDAKASGLTACSKCF